VSAAPAALREALRGAERRMAAAGVSSPDFDARALAAHVLGVPLSQLPLDSKRRLSAQQVGQLEELVGRRCAREPLQYITGETEFYGRALRCDRRALIPRPDTEVLAEVALELAREACVTSVVEVGTGTGAVAITLAAEMPELEVLATDASQQALELAAENVALHGLEGRVRLARGDCLEAVREAGWWERAQMIVSNPPYVRAEEIEGLEPEITAHEPREALLGLDADGLGLYRRLLPETARLPGLRAVAVEVGAGAAPAVAELMRDALPEFEVSVYNDYAGIERVVRARKVRGR
jgi:release factor glutamine methyltransferase